VATAGNRCSAPEYIRDKDMSSKPDDIVQPGSITIGIPVISRRAAKDWNVVLGFVEQALTCIARQTVPCRRVIVACHERPDVKIPEGLDVTFVEVDIPLPIFTFESELDKLRKCEVIGAKLREYGGGRLFLLDVDDLISDKFIEIVSAHTTKAALFRRGYFMDCITGTLAALPRFWRRCGSCAVVDWNVDELPEAPLSETPTEYRKFLNVRHFEWDVHFRNQNWTVADINEPIVAYTFNHGQNQSSTMKQSPMWRLYIYGGAFKLFSLKRARAEKVRAEFSMRLA
jgi:hypothetical protein